MLNFNQESGEWETMTRERSQSIVDALNKHKQNSGVYFTWCPDRLLYMVNKTADGSFVKLLYDATHCGEYFRSLPFASNN